MKFDAIIGGAYRALVRERVAVLAELKSRYDPDGKERSYCGAWTHEEIAEYRKRYPSRVRVVKLAADPNAHLGAVAE